MNIDWIVAIVTFLTLVIFSFNYYTAFFVYQADLDDVAAIINERVIGSMTVDGYAVPVYFNATSPGSRLLYADFPGSDSEKNSARVTSSGTDLPCMFSGNVIYWEADVTESSNMFKIFYSDMDVPINCDDTLTTGGEEKATPWAKERTTVLSYVRLGEISAMGYDKYRNSISVSRDLRVETDGFVLGPEPPGSINVYAFKNNVTTENMQPATIRVLIW